MLLKERMKRSHGRGFAGKQTVEETHRVNTRNYRAEASESDVRKRVLVMVVCVCVCVCARVCEHVRNAAGASLMLTEA